MLMAATRISAAIRTITNIGQTCLIEIHGEQLTNPFQVLAVAMSQLVFQNGQKIGDDVQPFGKKAHPLIHFKVTPNRLVDRF